MKELITVYNDELRCGSWLLSQGFEREHTEILKLCRKYENEMMEFENNKRVSNTLIIHKISKKTAGQPVQEYLLNEGQTIFLGTLLRAKKKNEDKVLRFKIKLSKDFVKQKKLLYALSSQKQSQEWIENRANGKLIRRNETDAIKDFIKYARIQGSKSSQRYYILFTKLCNDQMFICKGKFKNKREVMSASQLLDIKFMDSVVAKWIIKGMAESLPYKDIYQLVKKKVMIVAEIYGKSEIIEKQIEKREQDFLTN